ncbi:DUF5591 domain-containing protein [Sulfurisphaera ohwakuensis]|uniref:Putative RNA-binding protein n=1 Tax=Sulfurisphaera ohwakuensis TaxID=69656 RepID=A0A650CHP5_SULOH|nr:DUF5591 domain-containing protein [Sulfurisphaera ohwakuensis]MBB5253580.1 putative RNA-binding protein [Sulfurisphaera ohwakuensis]QGR17401.1 hypothetical protein D1869_09485 [Sulfurisphaera ohwakuensis]
MQCPPLHGERIIKREGEDPFKHPVVRKWYEILLSEWKSTKPYAILLPCTSIKPYHLSRTHKLAYAIMRGFEEKVQFYSVSEPMLLVPREYEDCYPFNSYDYPPSMMTKEEREEFVELLAKVLINVRNMHSYIIGILPKHHYSVVKEASEISGININLYPYGRLPFKTISEVLNNLKEMMKARHT